MKLFEMVGGGGLRTSELVFDTERSAALVASTFTLQRGAGGYSKWVSFGDQIFERFGKQIVRREKAPKGATVTELETGPLEVVSCFAAAAAAR